MKAFSTLTVLALGTLIWQNLPAQSPTDRLSRTAPRIYFEHLTTVDGLPDNSIFSLIQDHLGFVWVGTQNGLVRYDGITMVEFRYDPKKPFSLRERLISELHEDRNGDIWVGGENLVRYERATGRFIEYARKGPETTSSTDLISYIHEDKQGDIWTITYRNSTQNYVLDRFNPRTRTWTYFRHNPEDTHSLASNSVFIKPINNDVTDYSVEEGDDGKLWVVTQGPTENILHRIDPQTNRVTRIQVKGNTALRDAFNEFGGLTVSGPYVYLASYRQGLFRLNSRSGHLDQFKHDSRNPASLRCDTVARVHPHRDGSVWVSTAQGLDQLNPKTGVFRHITSRPNDPNTPGPGLLKFLYEPPNGDMWFRSSEGFIHYHRQYDQFTRYASDPTRAEGTLHGRMYLSFLVDKTGLAWIGSFRNGINKQSRIARFPLLTHESNQTSSLPGATVRTVYEAPTEPGIIWFGTSKGVDRLDKKTGHYTHYRYDSLSRYRYTPDKGGVSALAEDKKGRFWVGTFENGLYLMNRQTGRFTRFVPDRTKNPNESQFQFVKQLLPATDGTLWLVNDLGVNHLDIDRQQYRYYCKADSAYSPQLFAQLATLTRPPHPLAAILHPQGPVDKTVSFTIAKPTEVCIVVGGMLFSRGKFDYGWLEDSKGGVIWEMSFEKSKSDGFVDQRIQVQPLTLAAGTYRLRYKADEVQYYGSWSYLPPYHPEFWGIQLLAITAAESHQLSALIRQPYVRPGLPDEYITILREDGSGRIWSGSGSGGVIRIQPRTGQLSAYNDPLSGPNSVFALLENRQTGGFWVGDYIHGLLYLDRQGKVTRRYGAGRGWPGNSVRGIRRDQAGYLWLSTNHGLIRFNPATEQFRTFDKGNGLQDFENSITDNVFQASDGELYLWGEKGVHAFYPNQIQDDPHAPPIVLTDLNINGQPATLGEGGQLPAPISIAKDITLPHDQNELTFYFAALSYNRSSECRFAYQLSPADKNWVQSGTIRQAHYSDLSPGEYTFRVKAANADGVWNEKGVSIKLTIRAPWWQTGWAYLLYGLLFFALLRAYIVYRSRTLLRENRVLEEKVVLRTQQIQQQNHEILAQKEEISTQRDHLEQTLTELKTTQTQLIHKEKMASLGELTAGIAHEIQNPLNFVNNFSELSAELVEELEEEQQKPEPDVNLEIELLTDLKDNLNKITHHGNRASSIVKGMLEHARRSSGEVAPTDLNKLIEEYLRLAYHGLRAKDKDFNAELVTEFDASVGEVVVMPQEMGRVFLNLFSNAFYAVRQQQQTTGTDYQPLVSVRTERQPNQIVVTVRDNGVGMSDAVMAKIFQPFFTTKPTGEGTGLGLSLSYDIITKGHGGNLTVSSQPGQGAEFVITLPIQPTVA